MFFPMKKWAAADRPRERVRNLGVRALSTRELLALLIETGRQEREGVPARTAVELAGDLLAAFSTEKNGESSLRRLMHTPVAAIAGCVPGIGPAKATRILAALELGRRAAEEARPDGDRLSTARDVYERMRYRLRDLDQEEFHVLLLNTQEELIRDVLVSQGTLDASLVHARQVFKHAVAESAASVVLVHNHPSGEPLPSTDDRQVTFQLVSAGDFMGIPVTDHVIVGEGRYYSFRESKELRTGLSAAQGPKLAAA
ncbi:MAG TPA: DNA repair protein RadC [Longimicrobium sp.]|jgi:DNA repair protein RadC|nr:DNA repair protein RadC [Longimicrobium sp.]